MPAEEGACPGTFFQPAAAGDEVDVTVAIQCLLFVEDAVGKVTFASTSVDEGAVVAFLLVVGALAGMVTDASAGPHVVHGPDDGLARGENLLDVLQREHPLVYPVQMDDVCLLEFGQ